jgi:3-oxoacyl-[acyl-carrier protein] reductase
MAQAADRILVGRVGKAEDIGGVAAFLASDAAGFVNGITLLVNGGE